MMETKTYYDKDLSLILEQIKQELGADAIIVKSRKARQRGLLGFFQKPIYEVVVNYEPAEVRGNPLAPPNIGTDKAFEKSPLRDFGKEAQRRLPLTAPPKPPAKRTETGTTAKVSQESRLLMEEPAFDQNAFSELMQLASAQENDSRPVWGTTPATKVDAYVSMSRENTKNREKAGEAEKNHLSGLIPDDRELSASEKRAQELIRAMEAGSENGAPKKENTQGKNLQDGMHAHAPEKRKRGRPKKAAYKNAPPETVIMETDMLDRQADEVNPVSMQGNAHLLSRLDVVEEMLRSLVGGIQKQEEILPAASVQAAEPAEAEDTELAEVSRFKEHLLKQDVDYPVVDALMAIAVTYKRRGKITLQAALEQALTEVLGRPRYLRGSTKTARTVMMIGPTGVGKTTTLVKLAAGCMFERKANVAIINADVFRVGAQDQLNAYAKILDVPIKTIYETRELKPAIDGFADRDFVFIDTSGKPSGDKAYQNEIKELLKSGKVQDIYLVVSSTTSGRLIKQIVESYGFIKLYKTILTKIDESGSIGSAVNLCYYSGQPLSYITIGQNVPDDISKVEIETVISQLLR